MAAPAARAERPTAVLAVIPARGGSKGVPAKNLAAVGGVPLVARAVRECRAARLVSDVVVSTDDPGIAATARGAGAVVVRRPGVIAGDTATSEAAVLHAMDAYEAMSGARVTTVLLVQCTSPFLTSADVDGVAAAVVEQGADTALTVAPFHGFVWRTEEDFDAEDAPAAVAAGGRRGAGELSGAPGPLGDEGSAAVAEGSALSAAAREAAHAPSGPGSPATGPGGPTGPRTAALPAQLSPRRSVRAGRDGVQPGRDGGSSGRDGVQAGHDGGVQPGRELGDTGHDGVQSGHDGGSSGRGGVQVGHDDGAQPRRERGTPGQGGATVTADRATAAPSHPGGHGVNHDKSHRPRRQDRPQDLLETGAAYAMRADGFRAVRHRFFGRTELVRTDAARVLEVDDPHDLARARALAPLFDGDAGALPTRADVDAVVMDFDGTQTDDRVLIDADGREIVAVHRGDGLGVAALRRAGLALLILSTETNPVVAARGRKLQVPVLHGVDRKDLALKRWCEEYGLAPDRVLYVGNDVNDLPCFDLVGWPVAVASAHDVVRGAARSVTTAPGGAGALREIASWLLGPSL